MAASLIFAVASAQQAKPGKPAPTRQVKPRQPPPNYDALPPSQIGIGTLAKTAYLVDAVTDTVLLFKDADQRTSPSSMAKMMTVYIIFEELKAGRLKLDSKFRVSERARNMGGSRMFVELGSEIAVEDLIKGIITLSGNDACVVIAEGLSGTEENFAALMTKKARDLGMPNTVFKNSSGWPAEGQYTTVRDLAVLAKRTIVDFPEYYRYYAIADFAWNNIRQENRNRLLSITPGTDGLKTGHTEEAGFGLASSTIRDGRRIILVVNGLADMRQRASESARLTEWAFREYTNNVAFRAGDKVIDGQVWLGDRRTVPLVAQRAIAATVPVGQDANVRVTVQYNGPIRAPIRKGDQIGKVMVSAAPGARAVEYPLYAGADVPRLGAFGRAVGVIKHYLFGWMA
ncbi:MAG: D-alanyl-D-alanine carboxypeptidase [Alphaproteobacteria bacterium]|nr:D-alanyl-D-alanine carboxypeptidase [Alphaproteobacteria bacterium]MCW5739975.1 D-alanyl-D-alanine carboxypeptidase [Alphaproteobacteria bacterium]